MCKHAKREKLSWSAICESVELINLPSSAPHPVTLVAVERGGIIPAALIQRRVPSSRLEVVNLDQLPHVLFPYNSPHVWIIDDVYDSGKTLELVHTYYPRAIYFTLFNKQINAPAWLTWCNWCDPSTWLEFPWESINRSIGGPAHD